MHYSVRPYKDQDAECLSNICRDAITAIGSHAYSEEQVSAWVARHPGAERYRERVAGGSMIWCAVDGSDNPVAYALLEPDGHLDHLYNHPEHTRQGLAARVLNAAEEHARALGLTRLYTEASELARPAFERAGYTLLQRREFEIEGVAIHNYAMEKHLR
ncbi:MAG: GNAT family N-acetyltransferase [Marinomonas sp.]